MKNPQAPLTKEKSAQVTHKDSHKDTHKDTHKENYSQDRYSEDKQFMMDDNEFNDNNNSQEYNLDECPSN